MTKLQRIGDQTDILGECPIWDDRHHCLYWIDIRCPALRRYDFSTQRVTTWTMPSLVGSIALTEGHLLLVALTDQIALFDPRNGQLQQHVKAPDLAEGHRFNDGRCDRQGRFWVGTMHNITRAPVGVLYCLTEGEPLRAVFDGICIPNSLAFSPGGDTMYFADSLKHRLDAYEFDSKKGTLGSKRVIANTIEPGFPDGSAVDAQGYIWNAEFWSSRIVRYAPDGRIDRVVHVPVDRPTCCAFGGPDLNLLFITTTSQNLSPEQRQEQPLAGGLFCLPVEVQGLPESRYALNTL